MMSGFVDTVARFVERHNLLPEGARVLVGVSGGPDSMVCMAVLQELGYDVHALHVNYGLREGADADEALVRDWCAARDSEIPLRVVQKDPRTRTGLHDESLQEAARILRYDALATHATEIDAAAVAVGHHRDDQAETLLLNLLRGSGPEGLAGMPPARPLQGATEVSLIRPLLGVSQAQVQAYAEAAGVPWREDPTNTDAKYDRAFIRSEVIPLLQSKFPGGPEALSRAATLMRQYVDQTFTPGLEARLERCYVSCEAGGKLLLDPLRDEPPVWRRRLILAALQRAVPGAPQSFAFAEEVEALIDAQVGQRVEAGDGTMWRERAALRFVPAEAEPETVWPPIPVPWGEDVPLPDGVLRIDPLDAVPDTLDAGTTNVEYVDADCLVDPLSVRTWKEGDRLQPLGLDGTKLVSDLLTEGKVPPHRRPGVLLLSTDEHPAWIIGHRLDHRMRVRSTTNQVARLSWQPMKTGHPREKTSDDCNSA